MNRIQIRVSYLLQFYFIARYKRFLNIGKPSSSVAVTEHIGSGVGLSADQTEF